MKPPRMADRMRLATRFVHQSQPATRLLLELLYRDGEKCILTKEDAMARLGLSRTPFYNAAKILAEAGVATRNGSEWIIHYEALCASQESGRNRPKSQDDSSSGASQESGRERPKSQDEPSQESGRNRPKSQDALYKEEPEGNQKEPEREPETIGAQSSTSAPDRGQTQLVRSSAETVWWEPSGEGWVVHVGTWIFEAQTVPSNASPIGVVTWIWDRAYAAVHPDRKYPWRFGGKPYPHDGGLLKQWLRQLDPQPADAPKGSGKPSWRSDPAAVGDGMHRLARMIWVYMRGVQAGEFYNHGEVTTGGFTNRWAELYHRDPHEPPKVQGSKKQRAQSAWQQFQAKEQRNG